MWGRRRSGGAVKMAWSRSCADRPRAQDGMCAAPSRSSSSAASDATSRDSADPWLEIFVPAARPSSGSAGADDSDPTAPNRATTRTVSYGNRVATRCATMQSRVVMPTPGPSPRITIGSRNSSSITCAQSLDANGVTTAEAQTLAAATACGRFSSIRGPGSAGSQDGMTRSTLCRAW
jgi:hypothetical protein